MPFLFWMYDNVVIFNILQLQNDYKKFTHITNLNRKDLYVSIKMYVATKNARLIPDDKVTS